MYNDFNSLFDSFLDVFNSTKSSFMPPVDVSENSDEYYIEVEVPGYDKNDVDINIESYSITIKTTDAFNKKMDIDKSKNEYIINETQLKRAFKRSFSLPKDIDETQIKAEFNKGVLVIIIPKIKRVLEKTIEITDS